MRRLTTPSNSEIMRANQAIRTGCLVAYCSKCQTGGPTDRKGPERCQGCRHATRRLQEVVTWVSNRSARN